MSRKDKPGNILFYAFWWAEKPVPDWKPAPIYYTISYSNTSRSNTQALSTAASISIKTTYKGRGDSKKFKKNPPAYAEGLLLLFGF